MIQKEENFFKVKVQKWIVTISVILLIGKFIAFYLTNSVGILTDAMESIVNVLAGFISLYSLKMAAKPRDKQHPFGHGKIELISASIEGILIFIAGIIIIIEGMKRIFAPSFPEKLDIGIFVIALAGLINYILGWYSIRIGKKHNSIALTAGGKHLQSDTYSTIGLVLGLFLLYYTKIAWIDGVLALIFGSIIVFTGISILRKTTANLLDKADRRMLEELANVIEKNKKRNWIDIHNMKIIKYGSTLYIDCDLTLPWYYNINEGHTTCENLQKVITEHFSGDILISIHFDSCDEKHCSHCLISECNHRQDKFIAPLTFNLKELTESDEERNEK